ncbi:MAG TPA: CpsD/CapB family tyrosine-protein kinase [Clostridiales bacterium]|nr:CpsD/CapB family tyrosine-protein kinase [Clostridiales bacterium]
MVLTKYEKLNELSIPAEEAYKTLRTNIRFCGVVNKIKTITITSCAPGEGKTTTSINLAISIANAGMKTLLVDTDFRRPMIEKSLGINTKAGITDYIMGETDLESIIYKTSIENFYITPCGFVPPNPAELLSNEKFSEFIKNVRDQYLKVVRGQLDMIIFDTPPLGSVIDAAILSAQTDGVLLVIKSKSTNYKIAQEVKGQLEKANAYILGVVLNKIPKKDLKYGYRNYYNYYNKDSTDQNTSPFKRLMRKTKLIS